MLKLFWSRSFPLHYVAEDVTGTQWLIPITPMSPESWERRKAYKGNQTLTRCLECVERFYQPKEIAA